MEPGWALGSLPVDSDAPLSAPPQLGPHVAARELARLGARPLLPADHLAGPLAGRQAPRAVRLHLGPHGAGAADDHHFHLGLIVETTCGGGQLLHHPGGERIRVLRAVQRQLADPRSTIHFWVT